MPHLHSAEARARRAERARAQGYVKQRPPRGAWVDVPVHLASKIKVMARSVELHHEHDSITGATCHSARNATLLAASALSPEDVSSALKAHKAANRAKHTCSKQSWADMVDETGFDSDASRTVPAADQQLVDPLFVNDPWRHYCASSPNCSVRLGPTFPSPASPPCVVIDGCRYVPDAAGTSPRVSASSALGTADHDKRFATPSCAKRRAFRTFTLC